MPLRNYLSLIQHQHLRNNENLVITRCEISVIKELGKTQLILCYRCINRVFKLLSILFFCFI